MTAAAAAKSLQSCPTLCDPKDSSPPGFPSLGFSRQEHWSGLPFPSPMHESEKWKWSRSVVSDSSDPMDCSLPGSSVHWIFQAKVLEWGDIAFSVSFSLGPGNTSNWPFVDSLETSLRASWLSIFWSLFCASYLSGCLLPLQLLVFQWQLPADAPCCRQWLFYAGNFVVKTCLVSPFCTVWCTAG